MPPSRLSRGDGARVPSAKGKLHPRPPSTSRRLTDYGHAWASGRNRPTSHAEAVVDPNGKVRHAIGPATCPPRCARCARRSSMSSALVQLRHRDPEKALSSWKGLVAASGPWWNTSSTRPSLPSPARTAPCAGARCRSPARAGQVLAYAAMGSSKRKSLELGMPTPPSRSSSSVVEPSSGRTVALTRRKFAERKKT